MEGDNDKALLLFLAALLIAQAAFGATAAAAIGQGQRGSEAP